MTRWVALGELLEPDRTPVTPDPVSTYRQIGVRGFGRGIFDYPPCTGSDLGKLRYFELGASRLVVSNIKGWEGAVAVTEESESGRIASNRFLQFRSRDSKRVNLGYLGHWLLSDAGTAALGAASPGSADRNRTLAVKKFESIHAPLPPVTDQRRIASHLDSLAAFAAKTVRALGADDLWGSMLGAPPAGRRVRVGDLVEQVTRPVAVKADTVYPMFGVRWYGEGIFERERKMGSSLSAKTVYQISEGDLVYNRLFAWKQSFGIADTGGYASNEFPTFRIDQSTVRAEVLRYLLLTRPFTAAVNEASSGSTPTSRNRLKVDDFLELTLDLPPLAEQDRLVRRLSLVDTARRAQQRKNALATAILPAARNQVFNALR